MKVQHEGEAKKYHQDNGGKLQGGHGQQDRPVHFAPGSLCTLYSLVLAYSGCSSAQAIRAFIAWGIFFRAQRASILRMWA